MSESKLLRQLPSWIRWLHLYVSLAGFAALLFFALTGITLNHSTAFESSTPKTSAFEGRLPSSLALTSPDERLDRAAIAEALRAAHGLHGSLAEFNVEKDALSLVFKGPGSSAEATIERATGDYRVTESRLGLFAVIDDLHKGRDSGSVWSLVIDASAIVMSISALTGIWLLLYVRRRRAAGLLTALIGAVVLFMLWRCCVA